MNGNTLIESNIFYPTMPYEEGVTEYPVKLGADEYFVMADQRNGGMDSRYFARKDMHPGRESTRKKESVL